MDFPVIDAKATGMRIKSLRIKNHLKVEDIATFMGFESVQAIYKWQRGESLPTVDNLYALSALFGTSIDNILCGNREEEDVSPLSFFALNMFYLTTLSNYFKIKRYVFWKVVSL